MSDISQILENVHEALVQDLNELADSPIKKIVVVYAGRFQPMGKHHAATYKWAQQKFKGADVYLGTSNKVELPKSPFTFDEKKKIAAKYGIRKVVQVKNPYVAVEIVSKYDPETTAAVFIVGQKDADRIKGGKFFHEWDGHAELGYRQGAYYQIAPHVSLNIPGYGEMSGTTIRQALGSKTMSDAEKQKVFKGIFGFSDPAIYKMVTTRLESLDEAIVYGKYTVRDITDFLYNNSIKRILVKEIQYNSTHKDLGTKIIEFICSGDFEPAYLTPFTSAKIGWEAAKWLKRPTHRLIEGTWRSVAGLKREKRLNEDSFGHAYRELKLAGLLDHDSDYGGLIGKAVLELVNTFNKQGHSGFSAQWVRELFAKLSNYENLTPITENPKEWENRTEISGYPLWQNRRNPAIFSENGGQTWWDVSTRELTEARTLVLDHMSATKMLLEGGSAGHMRHPFDDNGMTFGGFEDMITQSLQGTLDASSVAEKCISGDSLIQLEHCGLTKISDIVDNNIDDNVLAFNTIENVDEFLPIINRFNNDIIDDWLEIELENGYKIQVTPNHKIYINGIGFIPADELLIGNDLKIIV